MTAVDHPTVVRAVPASGRLIAAAAFAMPPVILLAVALGLGLQGGGVAAEHWQPVAIGIAASIFVLAAVGAVPRLQPAALPTLIALVALLAWTAASITWTASREATFEHFLRVGMLAAAAFVGVAFAARPRAALSLAAALALFGAAAAAALEAKLLMGDTEAFSGSRLSWPIHYANADAALVWLPIPAVVALAGAAPLRPLIRGALAGFAALALAVGLATQSRGGAIALVGALLVSVVVARDRSRFVLTLIAIAAPVAAVAPRMVGTDAAVSSDLVRDRGQAALVAALAAATLVGILAMLDRRRRFPFGRAAAPVAVIASILALTVAAGTFVTANGRPDSWLSARWDEFSNPGAASAAPTSDATHFGSGTSNRYDYWRVAWRTFEDEPLHGVGAGAFGVPWFQSRSIDENVTDPHSWQASALAELGLVGFVLLAVALLLPLAAIRRARMSVGAWPIAAVALAGSSVYFVLHASLDWLLRIPAIAIPGFVVLGALAASGGSRVEPVLVRRGQRAALAAASIILLALAVPAFLSTAETSHAETMAATSAEEALDRLDSAADFNPFAVEPVIVRAIILNQQGRDTAALEAARRAADRGRKDWKAWLVLAHAERAAGNGTKARAALARTRALNPRLAQQQAR